MSHTESMVHTPPKIDKASVLYIDDDPANRSLVNRLLSSYQFEVLEAETGLEGISIAKKERPDLILMDINMPGLDGHETTTRMRGIPALEHTPIIAVTARTTQGEREMALAAGCDGYIPKPIDVDHFPHQIIAYLDGQKDTITGDERQLYLGQYSRKLVERLEQKILELQEANSKLQKIDKAKSDFITLTAHELRTPITLIYGYARLLQLTASETLNENPAKDSISDLAAKIFDSVSRLNEAVNDILNIALIQENKMQLDYQPTDLGQIINAALHELKQIQNNRILTIELDDSLKTLPAINGDAQRLQQVFWNLLSNAIKFTPDGGSIFVNGRVIDSPSSQVKAAPGLLSPSISSAVGSGGGILIAIEDTGIGIDPAEQAQIFDRFYVVGNTDFHTSSKTAYAGGGLGLGLPIAHGIIKTHNGKIWVESPGQDEEICPGSTFYVYLPLGVPGP